MASSVTVEVKGLQELGAALRELGDEVHLKIARQATRAAANLVRDNAKSLAPVETGALRDAIQVRRDTKISYPGYEVMGVGVFKITSKKITHGKGEDSPAFYWKFVEFGTVKMSAKPFLRPGFDGEKGDAVEVMGNTIAVGIERKTRGYK